MAELVIVIIENSSPRTDFRFKKAKYEILSSVVGFSISYVDWKLTIASATTTPEHNDTIC